MDFSVIMSVYAKENPIYLDECLKSLSCQTLRANEIVLVEDGPISSELTLIIDSFRNELNIISVHLLENVGLGAALNEGLKNCTHEVVARMDTDDIALPERFEKQIAQLKKNPKIDILGAYAQDFNEEEGCGFIRKMPIGHMSIWHNLFSCPFIHPTVIYRKKIILSVGGYDEKLMRRQDYDLWFRCALHNAYFENIPEILLNYRFTNETHSRQSIKILWLQGLIGFNGVKTLKQPIWMGIVAFFPLIRSLFPRKIEHFIYKAFKRFDPRQRETFL
jgi:glycosyltransferase involved in cell wall biosynthesis